MDDAVADVVPPEVADKGVPSIESVRKLIELVQGGGDGSALVRMLGGAQLSSGQRDLFNLFSALEGDLDPEARPESDSASSAEADELGGEHPSREAELAIEVQDLREVNDTLASALGACLLCWGGDEQCDVCGGDGASGYSEPDAELFGELVAPALRRLRSEKAGRRRPRIRARRAHDPRER